MAGGSAAVDATADDNGDGRIVDVASTVGNCGGVVVCGGSASADATAGGTWGGRIGGGKGVMKRVRIDAAISCWYW